METPKETPANEAETPANEVEPSQLERISALFATIENLTGLVKNAKLNLDDAEALVVIRDAGMGTASDIARSMGISRPKATRVMRRLAEAGLDRRAHV